MFKAIYLSLATRTAPLAALSQQVCHLVAQMTLVRGKIPLIPPYEMRLTMRRETQQAAH